MRVQTVLNRTTLAALISIALMVAAAVYAMRNGGNRIETSEESALQGTVSSLLDQSEENEVGKSSLSSGSENNSDDSLVSETTDTDSASSGVAQSHTNKSSIKIDISNRQSSSDSDDTGEPITPEITINGQQIETKENGTVREKIEDGDTEYKLRIRNRSDTTSSNNSITINMESEGD